MVCIDAACNGTDAYGHSSWLHSHNIDHFIGCTVIEGSMEILQATFTGYVDIHEIYRLVVNNNIMQLYGRNKRNSQAVVVDVEQNLPRIFVLFSSFDCQCSNVGRSQFTSYSVSKYARP